MRREREAVRDFTPMVIADLIVLCSQHERVICENDIDIGSIVQITTHAVMISNHKTWDDFTGRYKSDIRRRGISEDEKQRLICKVDAVWEKGKPENPRGVTQYGMK